MIKEPLIYYCEKERIYPAFGMAYPKKGMVCVRKDLPRFIQEFVEFHERYHLKDSAQWWLWRETKASWYSAWKHPLGFVGCMLMSLTPSRLAYYAGRFRKEK